MLFQLPYRIRVDPRARGRARVPKNMHKVSTGDAFLFTLCVHEYHTGVLCEFFDTQTGTA